MSMLEDYINTYDITRYDYLHIIRMLNPAGEITTIRYILSNYKCPEEAYYQAGFNFRSARSHKRMTGETQDWKADLERGRKSNSLHHDVFMRATFSRQWGEHQQAMQDEAIEVAKRLRYEALLSYRPTTEDTPGHDGTTEIHSILHTIGVDGDYLHRMEVMA
tara:strand:+ start:474 stop:959 length:486 start_codon:yes stop_codon:yes gene_type:complete